ncbi:DUF4806 domain-containing protein, partial [Aphis craccivora]
RIFISVPTFNSFEIDYFVTAWQIPNHEELNNLETKLQVNKHDLKVVSKVLELLRFKNRRKICQTNATKNIMKKRFSDNIKK